MKPQTPPDPKPEFSQVHEQVLSNSMTSYNFLCVSIVGDAVEFACGARPAADAFDPPSGLGHAARAMRDSRIAIAGQPA